MNISDSLPERDLIAIQTLLNNVIATSTALYDYHPRPSTQVQQWMQDKQALNLPLRVAHDRHGQFLGFATYGAFRPHPAYKYTAEHSVYVCEHARGQGVGKMLLQDIIDCAIARDIHLLIGAIDAGNQTSIALHEKLGFERAGIIGQAGFKFGQWLDLALFQKRLPTPLEPRDG